MGLQAIFHLATRRRTAAMHAWAVSMVAVNRCGYFNIQIHGKSHRDEVYSSWQLPGI
jgi:hypothetical protein